MAIRIGKFRYKQSFKKDYNQLPPAVRKRADRCLEDLLSNPFPRSRQVKKRKGARKNNPDIWQARVTRDVRLTFEMDGETAILRRIDTHSRVAHHD